MNFLKKVEESFEEWIMGILLVCMAVILLIQIGVRTFGSSLTWAEELARYFYVGSVFLSVSYTIRKGNYLKVELLLDTLPGALRRVLLAILDVINIALWAFLTYYAVSTVQGVYATGQTSPALVIPMYLIYSVIPIGFALAAVRSVQRLYFDMTGKHKDVPSDPAESA